MKTRFALIGKPLNPRKQNIRALISAFPRLWGVADDVVGRVLNHNQFQFLFRSEESLLSVLRRGPWSFNEWMVSIQRWVPNFEYDDLQYMSFWVQVRGIPCQYLTERMVVHIGHILGQFIETDFQSEGTQNVVYVRIRLLLNVTLPLRFQRLFRFGNQTAVLKMRYEKLRGFCNICGMVTHDPTDCPQNQNEGNDTGPNDDEDDDGDDDAGHPPGFATPDQTNPPPSTSQPGSSEQDTTPSKKRKTESSAPAPEMIQMGCESHQGVAYEEITEHISKVSRRQSDVRDARQWFQCVHDPEASSSHASVPGQDKQNDREGTVGQKPPASE